MEGGRTRVYPDSSVPSSSVRTTAYRCCILNDKVHRGIFCSPAESPLAAGPGGIFTKPSPLAGCDPRIRGSAGGTHATVGGEMDHCVYVEPSASATCGVA